MNGMGETGAEMKRRRERIVVDIYIYIGRICRVTVSGSIRKGGLGAMAKLAAGPITRYPTHTHTPPHPHTPTVLRLGNIHPHTHTNTPYCIVFFLFKK